MARDDSSAPSQEQPSYSPEGGRPKKPAAERRSERVTINLKPSEREAIEAKAETAGLSMSGLMRRAALGREVQSILSKRERHELSQVVASLETFTRLMREHGLPKTPGSAADRMDAVIARVREVAEE